MTCSQRPTVESLLLAATILAFPLIVAAPTPAAAQMGTVISVQIAPPMLPIYSQPPLPAYGYLWTPGYWSWSEPVGYYWVPGTWVRPPVVGLLWTPPYWAWANGAYVFNSGYWGPHVGFYGGVDYGYGYGGHGYEGGRWEGRRFAYNRTANNFGTVHVANVYTQHVTIINNSHVSYAGGTGGLTTLPTAEERQADQDHHVPLTLQQTKHVDASARTPTLAATQNNGRPGIAATSHPAQFTGAGVVRAQPANGAASTTARGVAPHPAGAAPAQRPAPQAAGHATTPSAAAPHLAAGREPMVEHPAPRPAERAVARPTVAAPGRPAEGHPAAAHAAAPHPAAAHEASPAKGDDAKKQL